MLLNNRDVALSQKPTFDIKGQTQFLVKSLCIWSREPIRINTEPAGKICFVLETGKSSSAPTFSLFCPQAEKKWLHDKKTQYALKKRVLRFLLLWNSCSGCHLSSLQNCETEARAHLVFRCSNPLHFLGICWFQRKWSDFSNSDSCSRWGNASGGKMWGKAHRWSH